MRLDDSDILNLRFWMGWRHDQVHSSIGQAVFQMCWAWKGLPPTVRLKQFAQDSVESLAVVGRDLGSEVRLTSGSKQE